MRYVIGRAKEISLCYIGRYIPYTAYAGCSDMILLFLARRNRSSSLGVLEIPRSVASESYFVMAYILFHHAVASYSWKTGSSVPWFIQNTAHLDQKTRPCEPIEFFGLSEI